MKLLSTLSMLAFVVALAVVMTGSVTQAEKLLAPEGSVSESEPAKTKRSPQRRALGVASDVNAAVLYRQAQLAARSTDGPLTQAGLERELKASEPSAKVGQPLRRGGVSVRIEAGKVEFCQLTGAKAFACSRGPLAVGAQMVRGEGRTLAQARGQAAARDPDAKRQGSAPPAGEGQGSSGGAGAIDRARKLPGAGQ